MQHRVAVGTDRTEVLHRINDVLLADLSQSDRNAIKIGLTGTPLLGDDYNSRTLFGDYIHKYYYNASIADGYTLRLIRETRFDQVHVAAYSERPGTPAARLADDVPQKEKERRRRKVEALQETIAAEISAQFLGQVVEVLVDGSQKGRWRGRTRTNRLVFFSSAEDWLGRLARVRITWTGPWSMIGEVVGPAEPPTA